MAKRLEQISLVLAGLIGVMYAVGYLVSAMYFGAWGIQGTSLELVRPQYVHIGFLCLTPPLCIAGLPIVYAWQKQLKPKIDNKDISWSQEGLANLVLLIFGLWLVALLARPKAIINDLLVWAPMVALPAVTILGLWVANKYKADMKLTFENNDASSKGNPALAQTATRISVGKVLKGMLLVPTFFLVLLLLLGVRENLVDLLSNQWRALLQYALLGGLIAFICWRLLRYATSAEPPEARPLFLLAGLCLIAPLFYFMILAFAFGLFPYIPAGRGGANFVEARPVEVTYASSDSVPKTLGAPPPGQTEPKEGDRVFLIERAGDLLYLAIEHGDADAAKTSTAPVWRHRGHRPDLLVLDKRDVRGLHFLGDLNLAEPRKDRQ